MRPKNFSVLAMSVAIVVVLLLVIVVAWWGYPRAAVYVLAALCAACGLGRVLFPDPRVWFAAKDWRIDSAFFFGLAVGLCILAPMANVAAR